MLLKPPLFLGGCTGHPMTHSGVEDKGETLSCTFCLRTFLDTMKESVIRRVSKLCKLDLNKLIQTKPDSIL